MRLKRRSVDLPFMIAELAAASWATIYHRALLIAQGTCSVAEYERMMTEKSAAMQRSLAAFQAGKGHAAVLAPFLTRARANARRLGRKS